MEDGMGEVVAESAERSVDVPGLPTAMAMRSEQLRPAIEAGAGTSPMPLAGLGFDGASGKPARHRLADPFQTPRDHPRTMAKAGASVEPACLPAFSRMNLSGLDTLDAQGDLHN
jgi:hypothetical protein